MQIRGLFSRAGACKPHQNPQYLYTNFGKRFQAPGTLLNRPLFIQCPDVQCSVFNTMYEIPSSTWLLAFEVFTIGTKDIFVCKLYVLCCYKYSSRYSIAQKGNNQGYIVDVKLKICLNLDGQEFCIPINEMHIMNQVDIPVCQSRSLVDFRSKV